MALEISLRPAVEQDLAFSYQVMRAAMRSYVELAFGEWREQWQEKYHDQDFSQNPPEIVVLDSEDIGVWSLLRKPGRLEIKKIYLLPEFQRQGIGTYLIQQTITESKARGLPIVLRYLKVNPVGSLYQRLGFSRVKEDDLHIYVQRQP